MTPFALAINALRATLRPSWPTSDCLMARTKRGVKDMGRNNLRERIRVARRSRLIRTKVEASDIGVALGLRVGMPLYPQPLNGHCGWRRARKSALEERQPVALTDRRARRRLPCSECRPAPGHAIRNLVRSAVFVHSGRYLSARSLHTPKINRRQGQVGPKSDWLCADHMHVRQGISLIREAPTR